MLTILKQHKEITCSNVGREILEIEGLQTGALRAFVYFVRTYNTACTPASKINYMQYVAGLTFAYVYVNAEMRSWQGGFKIPVKSYPSLTVIADSLALNCGFRQGVKIRASQRLKLMYSKVKYGREQLTFFLLQ